MLTAGEGFTVRALVGLVEVGSGYGRTAVGTVKPTAALARRLELIMNYKLSVENATYPVEEIHIVSKSALAQEPVGKHFSFVSPVCLWTGQSCVLRGDTGSYRILVNDCLGFTNIPRYLVSGIITTKETAPGSS